MNNIKDEFAKHLQAAGFQICSSREEIQSEIRRYVGEQRYQDLLKRSAVPEWERHTQVYEFVRDLREANLIRSLDLDVTFESSQWLYTMIASRLTAGMRVIELGCWTGGLSSFIAARHPDCHVIGVDRLPHILEMAREKYRYPNLNFCVWDYSQPRPSTLQPADLLICGVGITNPPLGRYRAPNFLEGRDSDEYRTLKPIWSPYFEHWRTAAKDGAGLVITHRMATLPQLLSFLDAAHDNQWASQLDHLSCVVIASSKITLPCLQFTAASAPVPPASEPQVLARWIWWFSPRQPYLQIRGPMALGLYRSWENRRTLASRELQKGNGKFAREEIGLVGPFGYMFHYDSGLELALALGSPEFANDMARVWGAGASTPHLGPP